MAQTADADQTHKAVVVKEKAEVPESKDALRATETTIGKGRQRLRDIPQSVTVVTEKLMDDRNLDTVRAALKNTSGISGTSPQRALHARPPGRDSGQLRQRIAARTEHRPVQGPKIGFD